MLVDESDALLAGLRGNHHDDTHVVLVSDGLHHLQVVIERKVGDDGAAHATLHATLEELLDAVVHHGIQIAHQHQGNVHLVLDGLQLGEEFLHGHSVLQRHGSGTLYHRAVSQGVAEGNAHLYHVDALALHRLDDIARAVQRGTASTEIQAQQLAFLAF